MRRRRWWLVLSHLFCFWIGGGVACHRAHAQTPSLTFLPNPAAFSVITPESFPAEFPGWRALPVNSRDIAQKNAMDSLSAYLAAMTDAQNQAATVAAISTVSPLSGISPFSAGDATLIMLMQIQVQLTADLITIEAIDHAEQLNEKARAAATQARTWREWAQELF